MENTKNLKEEKVERKKLEEVCEIKRGRVISKKYLEIHQGEYPVYSSQTRDNGKIGSINTYDFDGEYVTWTTDGAYAGTIFYRSGKFSVTNICGLIFPKDKNILNLKFVFYWLQITAKKHVKDGSSNPKLMSNVMGNITIPIPSLETQEKIVKILDNFTKYVTELQAELQARNKQYDYYRNILLSQEWIEKEEGKEVEWKALEEVCKILNSKRKPITRKNRIEGIYPYYGANGIKSFVKDYIFNEVLILMGEDGSVMDKNKNPVLHWIENQKIWVNNHAHVLGQLNKKYNLKYIYYFLSTIDVSKIVKGLPPKLNQSNLRKIQIPIPSLKTQQKIIDILDKFEALVNDIRQGLPREIELRQKQYEYYREKLLSFG